MKALGKNYPGFYFKSHGGLFQKVGLPDIIGLHRGRFIGIEVKVPGKEETLTMKQRQTLEAITWAEGIAFMATSPKEVLDRLEKEFKSGRTNRRAQRDL